MPPSFGETLQPKVIHVVGWKAMKMLATVGALALISAILVVHAVGADAPSRPPGVSASEWAPVSDSLGIVLVQQSYGAGDPNVVQPSPPGDNQGRPLPYPPQLGALLSPPANGYFMVKRGNRWVRLVVVEPFKGPGDAG
jgi:hypothetical protein